MAFRALCITAAATWMFGVIHSTHALPHMTPTGAAGMIERAIVDYPPELGKTCRPTRQAGRCSADHSYKLNCAAPLTTVISAGTTSYALVNPPEDGGFWTTIDPWQCSEQGKVCRYETHGYSAYCVSQQEIDAAPAHDRYVENIVVADALSPADGF